MTRFNRVVHISEALQPFVSVVVPMLLPNGRQQGRYWTALNPTRHDRRPGSFKIDMESGSWADYATGDHGSDVISLAAYLYDLRQGEAAAFLANKMGMANDND